MKKLLAILLSVFMIFTLTSCSNPSAKKYKVNIISSIFPSYDFARQIIAGVDGAGVSMLIIPGTEPHSYEPSVKDMAEIKNSSLFIYLGGESDEWVESLLETFGKDEVNTLKMTDCVPLLNEEEKEGMQAGKEKHNGEVAAEGENDEHVWTSPENAILISEKIKDCLCEIDKDNAEKYEENFEKYKAELQKLDVGFKEIFSDRETLIVADRFPFRYLANEYGFDYFAAFPGCSTESDPSAATIAFLEKKTRAVGAKAVFYTEFSSQKVADTICEATGVKKLRLHSCHNVSLEDFENGATYLSIMKQNLKNIQEALK
ncbi:MAG: metal ABC transporter substrate-binding protein [Clostridia bacterium]|nr:metal ABC transporter substrate-binding protein [Clostridia bacterium]